MRSGLGQKGHNRFAAASTATATALQPPVTPLVTALECTACPTHSMGGLRSKGGPGLDNTHAKRLAMGGPWTQIRACCPPSLPDRVLGLCWPPRRRLHSRGLGVVPLAHIPPALHDPFL